MSSFPLAKINDNQLHQVGQVLWSWHPCDKCNASKACTTDECHCKRFKRLTRYFEYYKSLTRQYEADIEPGERAALKNHEDLFKIILHLKMAPDLSRVQLAERVFGSQLGQPQAVLADRECAIQLAVKVMAMVNCSASHQTPSILEHGAFQIPWRDTVPFSQFLSDIFPSTDHPGLNDHSAENPSNLRKSLTAKRLKKRAGIKFHPTDDLRRHLRLDRKSRVVEIYHHTAFLKEHLRLTKDSQSDISASDSIKMQVPQTADNKFIILNQFHCKESANKYLSNQRCSAPPTRPRSPRFRAKGPLPPLGRQIQIAPPIPHLNRII
jgi:hypothetical protein